MTFFLPRYVFVSPFLERKFGLHDTCGVHNLHGMPGVMGGLGGAISSLVAKTSKYNEPLENIFVAMKDGRTQEGQAGAQFGALCTTLGISIFGGLLTGYYLLYGENIYVDLQRRSPPHHVVMGLGDFLSCYCNFSLSSLPRGVVMGLGMLSCYCSWSL